MNAFWRFLVGDPQELTRDSQVAAIKQLLQTHCRENRLQIKHAASDKREVYSTWDLHRHRLQAKTRRGR